MTTQYTVRRVLLGVLLLVAAVVKLTSMGVFQAVVALSGLVPPGAVLFTAWGITIAESITGVMLVDGARRHSRRCECWLWAAAFLFAIYLDYDLYRLLFGVYLPGPFFGVWSWLPAPAEAVVAAVCLAVAGYTLTTAHLEPHSPEQRLAASSHDL